MKKLCKEAEKIMTERFGKDTVIGLATVEKGVPYVRYVNAYVDLTDGVLLSHGTKYEF